MTAASTVRAINRCPDPALGLTLGSGPAADWPGACGAIRSGEITAAAGRLVTSSEVTAWGAASADITFASSACLCQLVAGRHGRPRSGQAQAALWPVLTAAGG